MPGIAQACTRVIKLVWLALLPRLRRALHLPEPPQRATPPGRSTSTATSACRRRRSCTAPRRTTRPSSLTVRAAVAAGHSPIEYRHGVFADLPGARAARWACPSRRSPLVLAEWLWLGCLLAAGGLALRLAGVRDWRVYAAPPWPPPVVCSLFYGAVDSLLMLGLAACWRWRDHAGRAGARWARSSRSSWSRCRWSSGSWPRGAGAPQRVSLAVAGALALVGWALIGFGGLGGLSAPALAADRDRERARLLGSCLRGRARCRASTATLAPWAIGLCLAGALCIVARRGPSCRSDHVLARRARRARVLAHRVAALLRLAARPARRAAAALRPGLDAAGAALEHARHRGSRARLPAGRVRARGGRDQRLGAARAGAPDSLPRGLAASLVRVDDARVSAALQRRSVRAPRAGARRPPRVRGHPARHPARRPAARDPGGQLPQRHGRVGDRLRRQLLRARRGEILHGVSPYHPAELERVRQAVAAGHRPDEYPRRRLRCLPGAQPVARRAVLVPPARPGRMALGR